MTTTLSAAVHHGRSYRLACFTPRHKGGPSALLHYGLFDEFGCLYAVTTKDAADHEWGLLLARSLSHQGVA